MTRNFNGQIGNATESFDFTRNNDHESVDDSYEFDVDQMNDRLTQTIEGLNLRATGSFSESNFGDSSEIEFETSFIWVNRFKVTQRLGSGGMGVVFKAFDNRLNREVALKLVKSNDPFQNKKLIEEAVAAAKVTHPNIVRVYDASCENDQSFIVMELMETSVADKLHHAGRFNVMHTIDIAIQCAKGLSAAHKAGIVHLDVKPHNLLLDIFGNVLVSDFGLSRTHTTADLRIITGTPSYMSPEQALGEPTKMTSDIYSLGATVFELLTGTALFNDLNTMKKLEAQIKVSAPDVRSIVPEIPHSLAKIVAKCLRKNPDNRFQSMDELIQALEVLKEALTPIPKVPLSVSIVKSPYTYALIAAFSIILAFSLFRTSELPEVTLLRQIEMEENQNLRIEKAKKKFLEMNPELSPTDVSFLISDKGMLDLRFSSGSNVSDWKWISLFGKDLEVLIAPNCNFSSSSILSGCKNLKVLNLSYNSNIREMDGIIGIPVETVELRDTNLISLDFLRGNNSLKKLVVNRTPLTSENYGVIDSPEIQTIIGSGDRDLFNLLRQKFPSATIDMN